MPQVVEKPTTTVEERPVEAPIRAKPEVAPRPSPVFRWLGWVLVALLIIGGAGVIWYSVAMDTTEVATADVAPPLADIDIRANPELKGDVFRMTAPSLLSIDLGANPELKGYVVGMTAPSLDSIDLRANPEVAPYVPGTSLGFIPWPPKPGH